MQSVTWIVPEFNAMQGSAFARLKQGRQTHVSELTLVEYLYRRLGGEGPVPHAALWAHHFNLPEHAAWLMIEPVEWGLDHTSPAIFPDLCCLGNAHLDISTQEMQDWIDSLNADFKTRGWTLYAPTPKRWLLGLLKPPAYQMPLLEAVLGSPMDLHSPLCGRSEWNGLMLAFQMILHAHPHNQTRADKGLPQVNGVWISGSGKLPVLTPERTLCVVTEDPQAQVLAELACAQRIGGVMDFHTVHAWMQAEKRSHLIVHMPSNAGTTFEQHWIEPFWHAFDQKKCRMAQFLTKNTCYDFGKETASVLSLF